jgi:hypothetical protein
LHYHGKSSWKIIILYFCVALESSQGSWALWCVSIILALGRLRQEDQELEASLDYIKRPVSKNKTTKQLWQQHS